MPDRHEDEPDPHREFLERGRRHEDEPVLPSTEPPEPRLPGPPEVEALHMIDALIGNDERLGRKRLGEVRGIVLDTLNRWHTRQRERQRITAGDRPAPLPSELLGSCDGGQGIAAFVLTPDVLDRLPVLTRWPVEPADARLGRRDDLEARLAEAQAELARRRGEWDQRSAEGRRQVERLVADKADLGQRLTAAYAERDDARRQLVEQGEAAEEQADALRAEVARLSGLLDESRRDLEREESLVRDLDGLQPREETSPHPVSEDPRRPHLDHYPEDAILLTYREVRRLLALHLEACADAAGPADMARAMREGETPLRLAEVLDR